ncbi:MAG: GlsB/YeaQ/YmgE family stress response membrane protein [Verrucomicrobia bacterium]|nr:GlsB/YeaQ/YmgE family stress response membrane protein [Verrucomicrobiota bacterium]
MSFLWMLLIGLIVGAIAKFLMPGKDPGGFIVTILIGIVGALVAGFLGRSLGWYTEDQPAGFLASVVGAILLLIVYRLFTKGRTTT